MSLAEENLSDAAVFTSHVCSPLSANRSLEELDLSGCSLDDSSIGFLSAALATNSTLKALVLSRNRFTDRGMEALAEVLKDNRTLQTLDVAGNNIGTRSAVLFGEVLRENSTLVTLSLYGSAIGERGLQAVVNGILSNPNSSLAFLDLYGNSLGDAGCSALCSLLKGSRKIEFLNVKRNGITPVGVRTLCTGIRHNLSLQTLNLEFNPIGEEGIRELSKCLNDPGCHSKLRTIRLARTESDPEGEERKNLLALLQQRSLAASSSDDSKVDASASSSNKSLRVIGFNELKIISRIGSGMYGEAFKCEWPGSPNDTEVVVKCSKEKAGAVEWTELRAFAMLPAHEHVLPFLGVCLDFIRPQPTEVEQAHKLQEEMQQTHPQPLSASTTSDDTAATKSSEDESAALCRQLSGASNYDRPIDVDYVTFPVVDENTYDKQEDLSLKEKVSEKPMDEDSSTVALVTTLMECSLHDQLLASAPPPSNYALLTAPVSPDESRRFLRWFADIASGLAHLHANGVIHQDIATRNMLVAKDGRLLVSDFGLSRRVHGDHSSVQISSSSSVPIRWLAPESYKGVHSFKSDTWSMGVCFVEILAFGQTPYDQLSNREVLSSVASGSTNALKYTQSHFRARMESVHPTLVGLLEKCFKMDPTERPTTAEARDLLLGLC